MTLQERIKKVEQYFLGMEIINNTVIIKVLYGDKWGAYPSSDEKIKVAKSEEVANEWFYYSEYSYSVIDEIFDLIDETIDMNLTAIERLHLFNMKIEELKELFSNEPLDKLKTLQFVFEKAAKKPKKRVNKNKTDEVKPIESNLVDDLVTEVNNNEEITIDAR